ncbi:MAG: site-specific integrase [Porphyromonadaceae bacterium]|nr:site-specific integrase [Porphyromonadaceae bacterium]
MEAMNIPTLNIVHNRKNIGGKDNLLAIQFEITLNRVRRYVSTGIRIKKGQWNKDKSVIQYHPDAVLLNKKLEELRRKALDRIMELSDMPLVSADTLAEAVRGLGQAGRISFLEFIEQQMSIKNLTESTMKQQCVTLRAIEESGLLKEFADLTTERIARFDNWLRLERGLRHQPTIYNYHKTIKVYVSEAILLGYIKENPYDRFKVERGASDLIRYLTSEELQLIEEATLEDNTLQRVRDLFLVQVYTGLAYSDLYLARFDEAETLPSGAKYIYDPRKKVRKQGVAYHIVLLPKVVEILEQYGWKLPQYSNQKYNAYLKALGLGLGINKPITSHMARHTFATTISLRNGVPIEHLSKAMGHTSIKTTQRYAKVMAEDVARTYELLGQKLSKK